MRAYISTYPPLGLVSEFSNETTLFTAILEIDHSCVNDPWQLSLWHSKNGVEEWIETPMVLPQPTSPQPISFNSSKAKLGLVNLRFLTPNPINLPTTFTVKFRNKPENPWLWVKEHQKMMDGTVISKPSSAAKNFSDNLNSYFYTLGPDLSWKQWPAYDPSTLLWSIEIPIESAKLEEPEVKIIKLGKPWSQSMISRWMALVRTWSPWLAPRQGNNGFELDKEAIFCSFLSLKGEHLVLLPTSCVDHVMTIFTNGSDGDIYLRVCNYDTESKVAKLLIGLGNDFEAANAVVMNHAISSVSTGQNQDRQRAKPQICSKVEKSESERSQEWYDGFSYCTWNALGQNLTEEKILRAVTKLTENKINVTNFIIDDNWQSTSRYDDSYFKHALVEFEAAPDAFPNGLKHTISLIQEILPSIQHIAVWHTIHGYWGGIAPDGKLAKEYKTINLVRGNNDGEEITLDKQMTLISKEDVLKFYDEFYQFLSACGVTAVKTDAQFILETFTSTKAHWDLIPAYLNAWTVSISRYFNSRAISCMSQTPQTFFHSQMSRNIPKVLARNSDDFFPGIEASHSWHIFCNAQNALFTQHLNIIPDWDMFQSKHKFSGLHAAARCVSGGPICITDVPGQHDLEIIHQITGQTLKGKTIIFRLSSVGKSLEPYVSFHEKNLFLIGAHHDAIKPMTGIVGIFNLTSHRNRKLFPTSLFPGVDSKYQHLIRAHKSGRISGTLDINKDVLIYTCIDAFDYDILSAYPVTRISTKENDEILIANLGLLDKMTGAAAVNRYRIVRLEFQKILIETSLKAFGILGLYISTLGETLSREQIIVTIYEKMVPEHTVNINQMQRCLLEVDTITAWREVGFKSLKSICGDEIVVKCIIELST